MAAASLVLSGCGDFLEPDSPSEFVPKDVDSFNELLLGEAYPRNDASGLNIFLNLMEDDIDAAPYQKPESDFQPDQYLAAFAWNPIMYKMMEEAGFPKTNIYYAYYEFILGCDAVLDYVVKDDVIGTPEKKAYVMAQALALRGFYYLHLVNIFGQPYNEQPDIDQAENLFLVSDKVQHQYHLPSSSRRYSNQKHHYEDRLLPTIIH